MQSNDSSHRQIKPSENIQIQIDNLQFTPKHCSKKKKHKKRLHTFSLNGYLIYDDDIERQSSCRNPNLEQISEKGLQKPQMILNCQ